MVAAISVRVEMAGWLIEDKNWEDEREVCSFHRWGPIRVHGACSFENHKGSSRGG